MSYEAPKLQHEFDFIRGMKPELLTLADRFIVPPFSILDTRQGYWQNRKRAWLALGIESELGREEELLSGTDKRAKEYDYVGGESCWGGAGVSVFDPVLTELMYSWFCPAGGLILDPFAGGSVRGIVATYLGYRYIGIDLISKQVEANKVQAEAIVPDRQPKWVVWDSQHLVALLGDRISPDFIFSCPPYFDLEQYSDNPADLSNAEDYTTFMEAYWNIISQSLSLLKPNRFACFVVGDIRDKQGFYRGLVGDTVAAFDDAGAKLYNEAILVNVAGSLPVRVSSQFPSYRKLGKEHQNILVFYKGNPKKIKELFSNSSGNL